jgi:FAD binding domain-containing protein
VQLGGEPGFIGIGCGGGQALAQLDNLFFTGAATTNLRPTARCGHENLFWKVGLNLSRRESGGPNPVHYNRNLSTRETAMSADKAKLKSKFTRRDTLKVLGSGAAALVAAEQLDSVDISGSGSANSADVAVVGAGFAGLSAARMLMRQGKKVAVLVSG